LSLFSQKLKGEKSNYCIDIEEDEAVNGDTDLNRIVQYLNKATLDESVIRSLKYEESYEKGVRTIEQELNEMQAEKDRALKNEAEAKLKEAEAKKREAEAKLKEAEALVLAEKERAEKEKNRSALVNMVKRLKSKGLSDDEIAENTGLSIAEIREILME